MIGDPTSVSVSENCEMEDADRWLREIPTGESRRDREERPARLASYESSVGRDST
jgi:hypothetical protein